jgi:uncharacterized protein YbjT (DUF2867 family)/uncharacterized membrane protein YagU involved in acid resistance
MRVLVTGATGYIGGRLVPRLLEAGHTVRVVARDSARLHERFAGAEIVEGDLSDRGSIAGALRDVDAAYYLVHSMSRERDDFAAADREIASTFADAARESRVGRIVYLGGLGVEGETLSPHLRSRHEVGDLLRRSGIAVTEFRAAMIVGAGSASFEMMRYLTERLPVMIAPKWVGTPCQPIAIRDVLAYLAAALARPGSTSENEIYEIGGADVLSYHDMMMAYASIRGLHRKLVAVPFFTPRLSSGWVHLVTPIPSRIARPLIDGLRSPVVVRDDRALRDFPDIRPIGFEEAVRRALDRYSTVGPETTWFDAYDVRTLPGNFTGATDGMLVDRRERHTSASPSAVFSVFTKLGGPRGWLYADSLWALRGRLDRIVGGIGLRRGRRSASELRVGDAVDFWRVEAYEADRLLRLRAEMRLPGYAWLEFETSAEDDGRTSLRQTAFFDPRGVFGYLYWYGVLPFHEPIFGTMASRIVREAERLTDAPTGEGSPTRNSRSHLAIAIVAGAVGSLAMDLVQEGFTALFDRKRDPENPDEETEAIAAVVVRLSKLLPLATLRRRPLTVGRIVHYVLGGGFALAYAAVRSRQPKVATGMGLAFGFALWILSDTILIPATRLGRPWWRYSLAQRANALLSHLCYAAAVEGVLRRMDVRNARSFPKISGE